MNKRTMLREIKKNWDNPEKLLDTIMSCQKQIDFDREILEKSILLEDIRNYSIAVAYTLNYKYGFGKKRLPGVMEEIMKTFDCFTSGHLNIDDCKSELDRAGVVIK